MMIIDKVRDVDELRALYESRPMQTDLFSFEHILNNPNLFCFYSTADDKDSSSRTRSRPAPASCSLAFNGIPALQRHRPCGDVSSLQPQLVPAIVSKKNPCQSETDNLSVHKKEGELRGFIFITQDEEGKLYLSGVSVPKNLPDNRDAIIKVCEAFQQDIYADTDLKHAVFMLKLAGFKHYEGNIYIKHFRKEQYGKIK